MERDRRWPKWVYGAGDEPDYRFSFANERTFLAWIRTALALLAGGVAVDSVDLSIPATRPLAVLLVVLALGCAVTSWVRWARSERALRTGTQLPSSPFALIVALGVLVIGLAVLWAWR